MFQQKQAYELVPGDILLHPLYRPDGLLFVQKHKKLSESVIAHIKKQFPKDFPFLVVPSEQQLHDFIREKQYEHHSFYEALKQVVDIHRQYIQMPITVQLYEPSLTEEEVETTFLAELNLFSPTWALIEQTLDSPRLLRRAKQIDEQLSRIVLKDETILHLYQKMRQYHDVLAIHSLNTTAISLMLGLVLELRDEDIIELCLATLFADIGFTQIPKEQFVNYLNGAKTNEEIMRNHIKLSI